MKEFDDVQVIYKPLSQPKIGLGYQGFNPRTEILPKGWSSEGKRPLTCDILVEHDVGYKVRDGVTLYADVLRPPTGRVPAIVCWSPFGKKFNGSDALNLMAPYNLGLRDDALSGLEKFEAPDPAFWVEKGYAIVNVDNRGSFDSGGSCAVLGTQEGEDGHDVIECIAKEPWCTGNIGMAGNSHLAQSQWFIAAQQPPSLKAIAPWEGCADMYRETFVRGGIYCGDLFDELISKYVIHGREIEGIRAMFDKYPLANDYWNDKRAEIEKIDIPTYITGTWSNTMHGMGAIRGWLKVKTSNKWLRFHPYQEWYDLWGCPESTQELLQFFDRYLKGLDNNWESTPRVRMALLKFGQTPSIGGIVEQDFPIPNTEYKKAYLESNEKLALHKPTNSLTLSYDATSQADFLKFRYTFDKTTRIMGMPKAVLYMSCQEHDDMDVFVILRKVSSTGEPMLCLNVPWEGLPVKSFHEIPEKLRTEVILYKGPTGIIRASQRAIDHDKSMHPNWPFHPHDREERVPPGQIIKLEIGIWATGIEFQAGESIQFEIAGHFRGVSNFGRPEHVKNKGRHIVHIGGGHDSHVLLPFC
ncbi:Alpha/Beta hydrolase protein [Aspergillus transmontanensis]|uniref:Alpha/Beta hydrolase protein n=1 Tax=Aspergillus transmontanensis TaxID=1034304 RepID=A0A5N6VLC0_9EURO|nr:Alpha/Beta hydrolase protein [Aspergillus transmontanensis]